jgi:hypothetical protein
MVLRIPLAPGRAGAKKALPVRNDNLYPGQAFITDRQHLGTVRSIYEVKGVGKPCGG